MNLLILLPSLGIIAFFVGRFIKHKSLYPFMPFRYDFRKRRDTFLKTMELIDDCDLPNGGKGKLVIAYMLDHGWKILMKSYQVLLVRQDLQLDEVQ